MTTISFLVEWALRSSILILTGTLLLWALRVKDPSIRLAAWTAMLCGSLVIPALTAALPNLPLVAPMAPAQVAAPVTVLVAAVERAPATPYANYAARRFDWALAAAAIYALVALALLVRLCVGLAIGRRLLRGSRATGRAIEGIEIRESDRVTSPVTLGIVRPAIVLPGDWRRWEGPKLDALLAHERSHVRRLDAAVQVLSAIHRALLWHSPLAWFLHRRIVRVAEEASDDAAIAVTGDRPLYAEMLLEFMQRGVRRVTWQGVPMARYGSLDNRIQRILDGTALSRGVTRWSVAAILAIGSPLAYMVAAAHPQIEPQEPILQPQTAPVPAPRAQAQSTPAAAPQPARAYVSGLGAVTANTVTIRPRLDGQLMSVNFREGETVQAGQLLATIDQRPYEFPLAEAKEQLASHEASVRNAKIDLERLQALAAQHAIPPEQLNAQTTALAQLASTLRLDQARIAQAELELSYTQIVAPITGVTGLRLVDPGNIVHATDTSGIVVITQVQPIAVVFSCPEDDLPAVLSSLAKGANLPVEAWNRANTAKLATGRLTAVDNRIDTKTGMAKLKAEFDNRDRALFPGQYVNVRLLMR